MTDTKIIERIKQLLGMTKSSNPHEAAMAAAKAQELIDRHRVDQEMLTDRPVEQRLADAKILAKTVYRFRGSIADVWLTSLGSAVASVNGCDLWFCSGRGIRAYLEASGTTEDLATIEYLLGYLVNEINRLCAEALEKQKTRPPERCSSCDGEGCYTCRYKGVVRANGRAWATSFRLGAMSEISERMHVEHEAMKRRLVNEAKEKQEQRYLEASKEAQASGDPTKLLELDGEKGFAIARVEQAVARIEAHHERVKAWTKEHVQLRTGTARGSVSDGSAYQHGRAAGRTVNLGGNKRIGGS